jgi:hypothetical protein
MLVLFISGEMLPGILPLLILCVGVLRTWRFFASAVGLLPFVKCRLISSDVSDFKSKGKLHLYLGTEALYRPYSPYGV